MNNPNNENANVATETLEEYAVALLALFPGKFQRRLRGLADDGTPEGAFPSLMETDDQQLKANMDSLLDKLTTGEKAYPKDMMEGVLQRHLKLLRIIQANPRLSRDIENIFEMADPAYKGDHPPEEEGSLILKVLSQTTVSTPNA